MVTHFDSSGYVYDPEGIDVELLKTSKVRRARIKGVRRRTFFRNFLPIERPWSQKCDILMPCATQNELRRRRAETYL